MKLKGAWIYLCNFNGVCLDLVHRSRAQKLVDAGICYIGCSDCIYQKKDKSLEGY